MFLPPRATAAAHMLSKVGSAAEGSCLACGSDGCPTCCARSYSRATLSIAARLVPATMRLAGAVVAPITDGGELPSRSCLADDCDGDCASCRGCRMAAAAAPCMIFIDCAASVGAYACLLSCSHEGTPRSHGRGLDGPGGARTRVRARVKPRVAEIATRITSPQPQPHLA